MSEEIKIEESKAIAKQLPQLLDEIVYNHEKKIMRPSKIKIIFYFMKEFFEIKFFFSGLTSHDSQQINGTHEDFLILEFERFIISAVYKNETPLYLIHNYKNEKSYKISVSIKRIKEYLPSSEVKVRLEQQSMEKILRDEKELKNKNKNKLYKIINSNRNGISLKDLIQKTRFFESPEDRHNKLQELINSETIMLEIDKTGRKDKKVYKAI